MTDDDDDEQMGSLADVPTWINAALLKRRMETWPLWCHTAWMAGILRARANITGGPQDYWELTRAFPLGDQDLLNMLFAAPTPAAPHGHPELLALIPFEYNYCIDPPWLEDLADVQHTPFAAYAAAGGPPRPCVIHYCGNRLMSNDAGKEFLDVRDPIQASFMWVMHWPLVRPEAVRLEAGPSASPPPPFFPSSARRA